MYVWSCRYSYASITKEKSGFVNFVKNFDMPQRKTLKDLVDSNRILTDFTDFLPSLSLNVTLLHKSKVAPMPVFTDCCGFQKKATLLDTGSTD